MKTTVIDYYTKESKNVTDCLTFVNNGDIKKTALPVEELHKYNDIDNLHCVFGAHTSINFQYSFIHSFPIIHKYYNTKKRESQFIFDLLFSIFPLKHFKPIFNDFLLLEYIYIKILFSAKYGYIFSLKIRFLIL